MNYLAHLFLAKPGHNSAVGSILADFTRIPSGKLHLHFNNEITEAILLHRRIDSYTDSHSDVAAACHPLFKKYRHWSRVIIDIAFDYFLIKHWNDFTDHAFDSFVERSYVYLSRLPDQIPDRFQTFAGRMICNDVLRAYSRIENLKVVFERLQSRTNCSVSMAGAWEDIVENSAEIEYHFSCFFPQLIDFADWEKNRKL